VAAASPHALRRAVRLSTATVVWNVLVGGAAIVTAISTGGLSLIGFGINAVVDSSASTVLIWRFRAEAKGHAERAQRAERLALRLAGTAFLLIALYLSVQAVRALIRARGYDATGFGIAEAAAALLVLPFLARAKYALAKQLRSSALRADSLLTWSGVALASLALISLLAQRLFAAWFVDPIGALGIAVVFTYEGSRAIRGVGLAEGEPAG
jgi:divalent metal cation (Fe/Co/Zn/Cd) transporter